MPTDSIELEALDDPVELDSFTRWSRARSGARIAESSFRVGGMHCATCAMTIESALQSVPGVLEASVSGAARCATVRWDAGITRASALAAAIRQAGYDAVPDTAAGERALRLREKRDMTWRTFVALFCAMQVMMLATPAYLGAAGDLEPDLKRLLDWGSWLLSLPVLCFSAAPLLGGAWRAIRQRRIAMDVPVALGILVAFVASSGAAFDPGGIFGAEVYFDSLTMFVSFLLVGRWLEMSARHRAAETLEDGSHRLPQRVQRVGAGGVVESVGLHLVQVGDTLRVPVGEAFAADGVLTMGETLADESLLTGEAQPVTKRCGDHVVAGSLNRGTPVQMRVERVGADTRYESIVALMREARSHRPSLARSADRWAGPFLWVVLLLAAAAGAVWSVVDPSRAVWVVVSVLIVTCPCALSLAAPSALLAAAAAAARRGVLLRRIDALETLAAVRHVFVDKTGTLTESALVLIGTHRLDDGGLDDDALRRIAASLAAWSSHPLARALAQAAAPQAMDWRDVDERAGQGLQAEDGDGACWRLGSPAWVGAAGAEAATGGDQAQVWLSRDGRPLARFVFDERVREDTMQALSTLRRAGVALTLLSGDSAPRVARLGRTLGFGVSAGGLAPEDKLAALREVQARGVVVAMVGDGINDAPVLAQADVSFAMGEGATIARVNADAVLLSNSLRDLGRAHALAQRTMRVVRQNTLWAAVYNAVCVPLALMGWLPPWAAGLGMAASSLGVVLNSLRLAR
jgi:Cu2+-exporting ATPase